MTMLDCPWCGPYPLSQARGACHDVCPSCRLDAIEVRYIERILADSTAVWLKENAEFQRQRAILAMGDAKA